MEKEIKSADKEILQRRLKARRLFLNMTYQDLAIKTGISKSTLQRYETGGIKNLPLDKVFTLSEALEVSPKFFNDLSDDYTGGQSYENTFLNKESRVQYLNHIKVFEKKALEKITPFLISDGYTIQQLSHGSVGDLVATKNNEIWYIDFLYDRDISQYPAQTGMGRQQLFLRFGRLAFYNSPITKYSMVVNNRSIAEQLVHMKPIHINIIASIIILKKEGYKELYF